MTTYVMEAKENYDPTRAAEADGSGFPTQVHANQFLTGFGYDATHREMVWPVIIYHSGTNDSGHTLWNGQTSVAPGSPINAGSEWNFWLARKNLDTGVVTFYDGYSPTQLVPAGIGGGDGTWRRYVSDTSSEFEYPTLSDPRTGDAWVHQESCELYVFRRSDSYALAISPLIPVGDATNPILPMGMETDWVYANEISQGSPATANLYLIPRLNTAAEIAADVKLAYATYALPSGWIDGGGLRQKFFQSAVDDNGDMWVFACNRTGDSDFQLFKFTKPSAFVYPTPPIDGGFSDVTPWTSTTGPNAPAVGATLVDYRGPGRMAAMFAPGRRYLILMSVTFSDDFPPDFPDRDTTITYTVYDTQTGTWASHLIGQGAMTSGFVPTTNPADTAFVLDGQVNLTNTYLDADNHYEDADYASRWFFVKAYAFTDGSTDYADQRYILLKLTWAAGLGAPVISQVVDEEGWDTAYAAYAAASTSSSKAISHGRVVYGSIYNAGNATLGGDTGADIGFDAGLYDRTANTFWWGGMNSDDGSNGTMFYLDAAFTGRSANSAQPPVLELRFSEPLTFANSFVRSYVGNPQL